MDEERVLELKKQAWSYFYRLNSIPVMEDVVDYICEIIEDEDGRTLTEEDVEAVKAILNGEEDDDA